MHGSVLFDFSFNPVPIFNNSEPGFEVFKPNLELLNRQSRRKTTAAAFDSDVIANDTVQVHRDEIGVLQARFSTQVIQTRL